MDSTTYSPGEITVELMQQILREAENNNSIVVLPCIEEDVIEEVHVGSCLSRVKVKYTQNGDTSQHSLSIIVKVVLEKHFNAGDAHQSTAFSREIQMYDEILPRMSALLSRALGDRHKEFSARVYYTRKTPTYLIAVEDLAPKGFKPSKIGNTLDLKHCLLALRTLARFHAASVMIRHEHKSLFSAFDIHAFREAGTVAAIKNFLQKSSSFIVQVTENSPEFGTSWANRLRHRYDTLFDDMPHLLERDDSGFNVLTHGDIGVHNVMFRHSESSGEVDAIMLVDFQCCSYNSPVLDLHQFIFTSASDDVRDNHVETLLREYHTALKDTLEALGAPPEMIITQKQLLEEFDTKILFGFIYATCLLPICGLLSDTSSGLTHEVIKTITEGVTKSQPELSGSFITTLRKFLFNFSQKSII